MLSISNSVNVPIKTPAPQETAGSVAFRGNKAKYLKDVVKNVKCAPVGKKVSQEEARKMILEASKEAYKKFKLEELFKTNPAEAKEVVMRDSVLKLPKDFINKIISKFNK